MINKITKNRIEGLSKKYFNMVKEHENTMRILTISELPEILYNSSAIDGSTLTLEDTEDILIRNQIRTSHDIDEIYAIKNLASANAYLINNPSKGISLDLILELHKILLSNTSDNQAGKFRSEDIQGYAGTQNDVKPESINECMRGLIKKYNAKDNQYFVEKIATFHAEFMRICPFKDGSGQIGRLLVNEQLNALGLPPIIIANKLKEEDYYPALDEYMKTGKIDKLTVLFAKLLTEALYRRITKWTADYIIQVSEWVRKNNASLQSTVNKAMRGTIPAFKVRGHWMIDEAYKD